MRWKFTLSIIFILLGGFLSASLWAQTELPRVTEDWPLFTSPPSDSEPTPLRDSISKEMLPSPPANIAERSVQQIDAPMQGLPKVQDEPRSSDWVKKFGERITIKGNEDRLYIKAGRTMVVLDASGKLIISSEGTLNIESKKDILFKADRDIRFEAGSKIIQSSGNP